MFRLNFTNVIKFKFQRLQYERRKSSAFNEQFINGTSAVYVEQMEEEWRKDPKSVHISWQKYFQNVYEGKIIAYQSPPAWSLRANKKVFDVTVPNNNLQTNSEFYRSITTENQKELKLQLKYIAQSLIYKYRKRGHAFADVDPLRLHFSPIQTNFTIRNEFPPRDIIGNILDDLQPEALNLVIPIKFGDSVYNWNLKELITNLENAYCKSIGIEALHLYNVEEETFLNNAIENPRTELSKEEKMHVFKILQRAKQFELFLTKKWPSAKKFGMEGCESSLIVIEKLIEYAAQNKYKFVNLGMAHRGRLNILCHSCIASYGNLFKFLQGASIVEKNYSGDVHYHFGGNKERKLKDGTSTNVSLITNPSHLESVNAILLGKSRGQMDMLRDQTGEKVLPINIHGDSSLSSLAGVYEALAHTYPKGFTVKGTFHIILDNKIGFTSLPEQMRSSRYSSDVLFMVGAPVIHVNGDDPEEVLRASKILFEFRHKFKKDVCLDLNCYRLFGHNEQDEPRFTQPVMYKLIQDKKHINEIYGDKLVKEGVMSEEQRKYFIAQIEETLNNDFTWASKQKHFKLNEWSDVDSPYVDGLPKEVLEPVNSGIKEETINKILNHINELPKDFKTHKGIQKIIKHRIELTKNRKVDWAICESLAIGSILLEGFDCRISGEDIQRGTFSHRHHVLHDQDDENKTYNILSNISPNAGQYFAFNSPISEFGTLGFEYGYSTYHKKCLVIWEAQFGDFANGGQTILDEYLSCGEMKWAKTTFMVLNLPHGLEGAGPEHSSSTPERFLQMCDDEPNPTGEKDAEAITNPAQQLFEINWIVISPSVPATYFHALRRQVKLVVGKPLINISPKLILRHPESISTFEDLMNPEMERLIPDKTIKNPSEVKKIIFSSGKVYFDLNQERKKRKLDSKIALTRVEQVAPFPYDLAQVELNKYPEADVAWVQEEPKNQGYWTYIFPRLSFLMQNRKNKTITYIGRWPMAASAPGIKPTYLRQVQEILDGAMSIKL